MEMAFVSFGIFWPLVYIPEQILIGLTVLVSALIFFGFRRRWLELAFLCTLCAAQIVVLVIWSWNITAAAAFEARSTSADMNVLDPHIEHVLMKMFWWSALVIFLILPLLYAWRVRNRRAGEQRPHGRAWRVSAVVLELFVLACMYGSMLEFRRMSPALAKSISPNGRVEVVLVPINCLIDVNGVVLWRRKGEFWWHPIGEIGDHLTFTNSASFTWDSESSCVNLLLDGKPEFHIDFVPKQMIPIRLSGAETLPATKAINH